MYVYIISIQVNYDSTTAATTAKDKYSDNFLRGFEDPGMKL